MHQYSLNELFVKFKENDIKRSELEGYIYNYFFYNQSKSGLNHWKRDEYEDYISWFFPRIQKAIDAYNDTGSSFEAFIHRFIQTSSKEYRMHITTRGVTEYSAWCAMVPELYAREETPEYFNEDDTLLKFISGQNAIKDTKRILALILKCYYYVSDDFIDRIAEKIEMDANQLREMVNKMQKLRQKRDDAIYHMKERIYCQYYRCFVYEKRLLLSQENTAVYNRLKVRLEKAKLRLEKMRKRMSLIRKSATNRQIAEVIGVKKGTVDASLYKLRAKLNTLAEKSLLN